MSGDGSGDSLEVKEWKALSLHVAQSLGIEVKVQDNTSLVLWSLVSEVKSACERHIVQNKAFHLDFSFISIIKGFSLCLFVCKNLISLILTSLNVIVIHFLTAILSGHTIYVNRKDSQRNNDS